VDVIDLSRYFAALLVVLGLLGGFAVIVRRGWLPGSFPAFANLSGPRAKRRLEVKESLILDPRRRVLIVKADEEEHVLLLGPERETLLTTRPAKVEPVFEPDMPDHVLLESDAPEDEGGVTPLDERREASA
jgi:flagellar protein FliO/FliZ